MWPSPNGSLQSREIRTYPTAAFCAYAYGLPTFDLFFNKASLRVDNIASDHEPQDLSNPGSLPVPRDRRHRRPPSSSIVTAELPSASEAKWSHRQRHTSGSSERRRARAQ